MLCSAVLCYAMLCYGAMLCCQVALQLWQRAVVERGENWKHETLDGVALELDEDACVAWVVPSKGLLELDYITYEKVFEAHYILDLGERSDRAIFSKLLERAAAEKGDNFSRATLNGTAVGDALAADSWRPPREGIFECDFVCSTPQHVSTRHYVLNLAVEGERRHA